MKAIILAAGKGTRMKHLTVYLPKPMLTVKDKPVLGWVMEGLCTAGIKEFCIITGYLADSIEKYFGDGRARGIQIEYRRQATRDGTAHAAHLAKAFTGNEPFLLTYGDILVPPDNYKEMISVMATEKIAGVIGVLKHQELSQGGPVFFDRNSYVSNIAEQPSRFAPDSTRYIGGIYLLSPVFFEFTANLPKSARGEYEITGALAQMVNDGYRIKGCDLSGYWLDVGNPEALKKAQEIV